MVGEGPPDCWWPRGGREEAAWGVRVASHWSKTLSEEAPVAGVVAGEGLRDDVRALGGGGGMLLWLRLRSTISTCLQRRCDE